MNRVHRICSSSSCSGKRWAGGNTLPALAAGFRVKRSRGAACCPRAGGAPANWIDEVPEPPVRGSRRPAPTRSATGTDGPWVFRCWVTRRQVPRPEPPLRNARTPAAGPRVRTRRIGVPAAHWGEARDPSPPRPAEPHPQTERPVRPLRWAGMSGVCARRDGAGIDYFGGRAECRQNVRKQKLPSARPNVRYGPAGGPAALEREKHDSRRSITCEPWSSVSCIWLASSRDSSNRAGPIRIPMAYSFPKAKSFERS
ncbi:hypothetical protein GGR25_003460 [Kaistia hirudinis]|uniref:Uncharacterized protein n=1 Tax=Kaistia hirudinis TaxID=1293440 RepID=A0A840ARW6_9HYPH|nr:hypothetical protein [Kaistia hirudinis]